MVGTCLSMGPLIIHFPKALTSPQSNCISRRVIFLYLSTRREWRRGLIRILLSCTLPRSTFTNFTWQNYIGPVRIHHVDCLPMLCLETMCPNTLGIESSQNISNGNSKQQNVAISNNTDLSFKDCIIYQKFMLQIQGMESLPTSKEFSISFRNFLISLFEMKGAEEVNGMIEEKSPSCQRPDLWLQGLNMFKYEVQAYVKDNEDRPPVLNQLSDDHFDTLYKWMGAPNPEILVVVGDEGDGTWTTNLLLEILHKPREQMVPFTAHLCGRNFNAKEGARQEFLIQDLVGQLIEVYRSKFDDILSELATQEPKDSNIGVKKLWDLFIKCVQQAGIRKLLIILDRVDYLRAKCSDEEFGEFVKALETVSETLWGDSVLVRVMVTSGDFEVVECFKETKALKIIRLLDTHF
ncbi:uncharacterized protein GGS22DRAFT_159260 [Annulohypoxylon maeteangense]|uniref:uncharacterized protein n=1 Tax=Annulohypoxylon maeteangense TaxID=1927788 RepID=UPI002008875C|nr:uncharacterized protein GGS22DRAFT_159260 [Annulohypoxylon maeteangense]KAI0887044.1 hypothetical protein GGS22DRAFT_159260 [Annulohypoxylon maeteangense]